MLTRFFPLPLLLVHPPQIEVWKAVGFVPSCSEGLFKPRDRCVPLSLLNKVCADVVVRIAKIWVNFDRLPAISNGLRIVGLERVCPSPKCIGFGGWKGLNGVRVKLDCLLVFSLLLVLVRSAEVVDGSLPKFVGIWHFENNPKSAVAT